MISLLLEKEVIIVGSRQMGPWAIFFSPGQLEICPKTLVCGQKCYDGKLLVKMFQVRYNHNPRSNVPVH